MCAEWQAYYCKLNKYCYFFFFPVKQLSLKCYSVNTITVTVVSSQNYQGRDCCVYQVQSCTYTVSEVLVNMWRYILKILSIPNEYQKLILVAVVFLSCFMPLDLWCLEHWWLKTHEKLSEIAVVKCDDFWMSVQKFLTDDFKIIVVLNFYPPCPLPQPNCSGEVKDWDEPGHRSFSCLPNGSWLKDRGFHFCGLCCRNKTIALFSVLYLPRENHKHLESCLLVFTGICPCFGSGCGSSVQDMAAFGECTGGVSLELIANQDSGFTHWQ